MRQIGRRMQKVQGVNHGLQSPRELFVAQRIRLQPRLQGNTGFGHDNQIADGCFGINDCTGRTVAVFIGRIVGIGIVGIEGRVHFQYMRMTNPFALLKVVHGRLQLHHATVSTRFVRGCIQHGRLFTDKDRHGGGIGFFGPGVNVPAQVVGAHLVVDGVRQG